MVSEFEEQEVRNAVDQAAREIGTVRFKNTESSVELSGQTIEDALNTDVKLKALIQVLEEKFAGEVSR